MIHLLLILMVINLLLTPGRTEAHPMGNFSINHYSQIRVDEQEIRIHYILDLAEIPAFQEIQEIDTDHDKEITPSEQEAYLSKKVSSLTSGLLLEINGKREDLVPLSREVTFPAGAGGLPTMKLSILYRAEIPFSMREIEVFYRDHNYPSRAGWKEMVVTGEPTISLIGSTLPTTGSELRTYPEEGIQSPPQILETRFSFVSGPAGTKTSQPNEMAPARQGQTRNDRFTALLTGVTPNGPMVFIALLIAFGLGAFHALSPGHGKTVVAAYLVGSRGTAWQALLLGIIVTVSHTIGVFLLGLATLYLSKFIVPERLYPWLGLLSGLAILAIGLSLLRQRWQGLVKQTDHSDIHDHTHHHQGHSHSSHTHQGHPHSRKSFLPGLIGLGVTGGIIPCPSALVVLLSAIAFHQVGFGLLLIVAFSAGLAATLVGIGLMMVYLGDVLNHMERFGTLKRVLPALSAAGVAMLGGVIAGGAWFQVY